MATESINKFTAKELHLWRCPKHMTAGSTTINDMFCLECDTALTWNLSGKYCHCGVKAIGFRVMSADTPVEFYCDEHFQGMPGAATQTAEGGK